MNRSVATDPARMGGLVTPIECDTSRLRGASRREYAIRFAFGGSATAAVGIVSAAFGPSIAGLFLAFPAILIASLTLLGNHDGNAAAGADALGAAIGALGLIAFGAVIWRLSPHLSGGVTIALAAAAWFAVAIACWLVFDGLRRRRKD